MIDMPTGMVRAKEVGYVGQIAVPMPVSMAEPMPVSVQPEPPGDVPSLLHPELVGQLDLAPDFALGEPIQVARALPIRELPLLGFVGARAQVRAPVAVPVDDFHRPRVLLVAAVPLPRVARAARAARPIDGISLRRFDARAGF